MTAGAKIFMAPKICPICSGEVPRNAKACPDCGACEKSGWSEDVAGEGLDLPQDEFDYDDFLKREFGGPEIKPAGVHWFWWFMGLVAFLALLLLCSIPFFSHPK